MFVILDGARLRAGILPLAALVDRKLEGIEWQVVTLQSSLGGLQLTARNTESTARVVLPGMGGRDGSISVRATDLAKVARQLRAVDIRLEQDFTSSGEPLLRIANGALDLQLPNYALPGETLADVESLDITPPDPAARAWHVSGRDLAQLWRFGGFAASRDDNRPMLKHVAFQRMGDELVAVSTNGHRLTRASVPVPQRCDWDDASVLIPPKALAFAAAMWGSTDGSVAVRRSEGRVSLSCGDGEIISRSEPGPYPNWPQVVPDAKNTRTVLRFDRDVLLGAVGRVGDFADSWTRKIAIDVEEAASSLVLASGRAGAAQASERVPVQVEGEAIQIAFNGKYFAEILRKLPSGRVRVELSQPERAVVFTSEESMGSLGLKIVFMPMRVMGEDFDAVRAATGGL